MAKARRGPHLLEAFGAGGPEEPVVPRGQTVQGQGRPAAAPYEPRHIDLGKQPLLVIGLSAGVLGALIAALVGVGVVLFSLGRLTARAPDLSEDVPAAPVRGSGAGSDTTRRGTLPPAVEPDAGPGPSAVEPVVRSLTYTVQVATYDAGQSQKARELAARLQTELGFPDVVVKKIGEKHVVCMGRFPSRDHAAAKEGLQRILQLGPDFRTAFINQLPQ